MNLSNFDTDVLLRVYNDPIKAKDLGDQIKNAIVQAAIKAELEKRGALPKPIEFPTRHDRS